MKENEIRICGHGGGYPSTKNMETYLQGRYNSIAKNGKHKGVICVRRLKKLTDADRKKFHDTYSIILGRNVYNQGLRNYVYSPYKGVYYSDCSSSGMDTFRKIGVYSGALLNTAGIYQSSLFETVPVTISRGHITNPEVLKVADAILFVGEDPSRPLQIGHVEFVFEMPTVTTKKKTDEEIANDVIAGKYGSGDARKKAIEAAGYNYETIRKIVNAKLSTKKTVQTISKAQQIANGYVIGRTYVTQVNELTVRESANGKAKTKAQLTVSGRRNSNDMGQLKKGVAVTCQKLGIVGNSVWMKIPSGWVCAHSGEKYYVK